MQRWQRPEVLDIRVVLRAYAIVVGIAGFFIFSWGPMWQPVHLAEQPYGRAALVRVAGAFVMAMACCAAGLAAAEERRAQRRGLLWFSGGHAALFLVVLSQQVAIWSNGLGDKVLFVLFSVMFFLFYVWMVADGEPDRFKLQTLFGRSEGSTEELRSLYEQQIRAAARQEERNRLARDLHDSIKQQIFVIQTAAATAQARFDSDGEGARQSLEQVRNSAREAMAEMQAMLDQMSAAPLENKGLVEALRKQCEALGFRTGASVDFRLGDLPDSDTLAPGAHEALLRVGQEALANIGRHARATRVTVSLGSVGGQLRLTVEDNGAGFDPETAPRGQGVSNMRARAQEFGGTFELTTEPGRGTAIAVSIPHVRIEPSAAYRHKAVGAAWLLVFAVAVLAWRQSLAMVWPVVLSIVGMLRYGTAWRRALAREREAR